MTTRHQKYGMISNVRVNIQAWKDICFLRYRIRRITCYEGINVGAMSKNKASLQNKIYRKIHGIIFSKLKLQNKILFLYPSVRHMKKMKNKKMPFVDLDTVYFTQIPNEGAGIGHQLANFIGGLHYAHVFGLKHACPHFKNSEWDSFFGFYENEITVNELKKNGYKMVRLPYFDEKRDYEYISDIIKSYSGCKVILQTELDQFYEKQYEEIPTLKELFEKAKIRKSEKDIFDKNKINIAVHVRRGDIVVGQKTGETTLTKRWLDFDYFEKVVEALHTVIQSCGYSEMPEIYIFSQGDASQYAFFEKYGNVHYCLDMDAKTSFLAMVRADIIVTSKSSFSYKPALLSDGIRICPAEFWHGYPDNEDWYVASDDGKIADMSGLMQRMESLIQLRKKSNG